MSSAIQIIRKLGACARMSPATRRGATAGERNADVGKSASTSRRVVGLDTWRFIAALWVVFNHGADPPVGELFNDATAVGHVLRGLTTLLYDGRAAVIVFFLISGFCIHYPNVGRTRLDIPKHFIRRYVRIVIPVAVAYGLARWGSPEFGFRESQVFWSIYCELIYYALYPALFPLFRRFGIERIIAFAFAASVITIGLDWLADGRAMPIDTAAAYAWPGIALTWLACLPAWLLGCLLAQRSAKTNPAKSTARVWGWRLAAWVLTASFVELSRPYTKLSAALVLHLPVTISELVSGVLLFAPFVYFWLRREIASASQGGRIRELFEAGGRWSYSIYLGHNLGFRVFSYMPIPTVDPIVHWLLLFGVVLGTSWLFFLVVEAPSHRLARRLAEVAARREIGLANPIT